jgi:hypothetical protein
VGTVNRISGQGTNAQATSKGMTLQVTDNPTSRAVGESETFRGVILFRMNECDDELISSIMSDVMRFLQGQSFFEKLDDALSPTDVPRNL